MDVLERFPLLTPPQQEVLDATRDTLHNLEFGEVENSLTHLPLGVLRDWIGNNVTLTRVVKQTVKTAPKTPGTAEDYAICLSSTAFTAGFIDIQCKIMQQVLAKYAGLMEARGDSSQVEASLVVGRDLIDFRAAFGADIMLYATSGFIGLDPYGLFNEPALSTAKKVYGDHPKLQVPREVNEEQGRKIDELVDRQRRHIIKPGDRHKARGVVGTFASNAAKNFKVKKELGASIMPPGAAAVCLENMRRSTRVEDFLKLTEEEMKFADKVARSFGLYVERAAIFSDALAANPSTRYLIFCIDNIDRIDPSASWRQFERDVEKTARKLQKGKSKPSGES